jgi:hypothetical protein
MRVSTVVQAVGLLAFVGGAAWLAWPVGIVALGIVLVLAGIGLERQGR